MEADHRRRRIDRLTDADYLDDLASRSASDVRAMRNECREEEAELSYTRRLLQGRVDIARAEEARRRGEEGELIDALPRILADPPTGRQPARATQLYEPGRAGGRRHDDTLLDDATLGRIPDLSDEDLAAFIAELVAEERRVSQRRATVLGNLDALQAELIRRYRDGAAHVDDLVPTSGRGGPGPGPSEG